MSYVYLATGIMIGLTALACLVRLAAGPTRYDRAVALDMLVITVVAGIALEAAWFRSGANVVLLAVVSLVGFLGSVSLVRLAGEGSS